VVILLVVEDGDQFFNLKFRYIALTLTSTTTKNITEKCPVTYVTKRSFNRVAVAFIT